MRPIHSPVLCLLALILCGTAPARAYENPILPEIRDPDCIVMDGMYHLVEPEGTSVRGGYFNYRTSRDLVHWSDPVRILKQQPGFGVWQASYYQDTDGHLYFYYAAVDTAHGKTVHVAKADSPTGPFTDLGVMADNAIDPYPFRDDDGTLWLYYKDASEGHKSIWVQKMDGPAQKASEPAKEILKPQQGTFEDNGYLSVEGPTLIKVDGVYFLLYTGGPFGNASYAVGYASASHPDGPFTRGPNNPILANSKSPDVFSPGVPSVVADGAGALWLVYRQRATAEKGSPRELTIDPLDVSKAAKGILSAAASSHVALTDPVPLP